MVGRYDILSRNGDLVPPGKSLADGRFDVNRITWGFALTLPGGSLLLVNHEHWRMPKELENVDVVGLRWVAAF